MLISIFQKWNYEYKFSNKCKIKGGKWGGGRAPGRRWQQQYGENFNFYLQLSAEHFALLSVPLFSPCLSFHSAQLHTVIVPKRHNSHSKVASTIAVTAGIVLTKGGCNSALAVGEGGSLSLG